MKKVFIMLAAAVMFVSCGNATSEKPAEGEAAAQEQVAEAPATEEAPAVEKTAVEKARDLYNDFIAKAEKCQSDEELEKVMADFEAAGRALGKDFEKELDAAPEQDKQELKALKDKLEATIAKRTMELMGK